MTSEPRNTGRLPEELTEPLLRLRRLIRRYVLIQGLVLAAIFGLCCFWLFAWLDYLPIKMGITESPNWARAGMLAVTILGAGYLLIRFGVRKWLIRWPLESLALLMERHYPQLEETVSTTIFAARKGSDFEDQPDLLELNRSMRMLSQSKALDTIRKVEVGEIIDWKPVRVQLGWLIGVFVASVVGIVWQPGWTAHWLERFIRLQDTPWPRQVHLRVDGVELEIPAFTGDTERRRYLLPFQDLTAVVVRGQGAVLRVSADTQAPQTPDFCTVYYQTEGGAVGRANLRRLVGLQESWQPFLLEGSPFEAMHESITFSVAANDLKLSGYQVQLIDSPVVAQLALKVIYPDYLQNTSGRSYLPETLNYRSGMRLPQGTRIELQGTANRKLSKVEYAILESGDLKSARRGEMLPEAPSFAMALGELNTNLLVEMRVWDASGLCTDRVQQFLITAIPDETPKVDMKLAGIGSAITPNAILPISANVRDDYGIQSGRLELAVNEAPIQRFGMDQNAPPGSELMQVSRTLDLKGASSEATLNVPIDSTLSLTVAAEDFAGTSEEPHAGRAAPVLLAVVSPDKLIIMLEKREIAMRARLELIISEMTQLRELLAKLNNPALIEDVSERSTESPEQRLGRLRQLRTQQASMQINKSRAELDGLQIEIGQIGMELLNNRIDSQDRRERLLDKVQKPIQALLQGPFPELGAEVKSMESEALKGPILEPVVLKSVQGTDVILEGLKEVLKNMIDIQDFNELIDMVRDLADQQRELLEQTKQEQKRQVRDLFK